MSDDAMTAKVRSTDGLGPDGKLHADGYFTWHRRDGYVLDAELPAEFVLVDSARAAMAAERDRIRSTLMAWHERDKSRHNYWAWAARELFDNAPD